MGEAGAELAFDAQAIAAYNGMLAEINVTTDSDKNDGNIVDSDVSVHQQLHLKNNDTYLEYRQY